MMLAVIGVIFLATIVIGVPIAFGMGLAGSTWILFFEGIEPAILMRRFYASLNSFPLLAIPLFIMLGILADRAGFLPRLVVWLQMILGRLRGGMAYINVVSAMLFAGISGTAVSDIASLGRTLIQLMTRAGYPLTYSAALTAATSIIGPIIAAVPAVLLALTAGVDVAIAALILYTGIQQLENYFLVPKIQGDAVELHPSAVMFALVIGGAIAGLLGAILARPSTAAARDGFRYLFHRFDDPPATPDEAVGRIRAQPAIVPDDTEPI